MKEKIIAFYRERGFSEPIEIPIPIASGVGFVLEAFDIVTSAHSNKQEELFKKEPEWCLMHDMFARNQEYCSGVLVAFSAGQYPSTEVISRTAIEGAVNLNYVARKDSNQRLLGYFRSHFTTERDQNKKWRKSVLKNYKDTDIRKDHLQKIDDKEKAIDGYEDVINKYYKMYGIDERALTSSWPNIFDRFVDIGDELGYRTIYVGLCSQAHNDAEDSLNRVLTRLVDTNEAEDSMFCELSLFSLWMALTAVRYHLSATEVFLERLGEPSTRLAEMIDEVSALILYVDFQKKKALHDIKNNKTE